MALEREILNRMEPDKPVQTGCGIVAIHNPSKETERQLNIGLQAASAVWHRGQQGIGYALQTPESMLTHVGRGSIEEVFTKNVKSAFTAKPEMIWQLAHCIYGTDGDYGDLNLQPLTAKGPDGEWVAVIHNGQFSATDKMRAVLKKDIPEGASDTYLFTQMLVGAEGNSWEERILNTLDKISGAYSLVVGISDSIFLARDPHGIRPLVLGKTPNGWMAASETIAFDKVGAKVEREVKRGEVIRINNEGIKILREGLEGPGNFCDFEDTYFSRPDSKFPTHEDGQTPDTWLSFELFRERCGQIVAREHPIKDATFVVTAPDSGIAFATGYANELGIPYRHIIIRDHYGPINGTKENRTFMADYDKDAIRGKVLQKLGLVPDPRIWEDAVVVVGDDSIIRGNVSPALNEAMFSLGAREIHWVLGFPPVIGKCHLGVSMRTEEELVAARYNGDLEKIAKAIGATSVYYISPEGLSKAKNLSGRITIPNDPKDILLVNGGCGGCVTGRYPVDAFGTSWKAPK